MPPNQMALYPNWLIVYVLRVIVPMLMLIIIAEKILLKSGREIKRAFDINNVKSLSSMENIRGGMATTSKSAVGPIWLGSWPE
jgi:hypothetical protein